MGGAVPASGQKRKFMPLAVTDSSSDHSRHSRFTYAMTNKTDFGGSFQTKRLVLLALKKPSIIRGQIRFHEDSADYQQTRPMPATAATTCAKGDHPYPLGLHEVNCVELLYIHN